ncbi:class I SAM-dependent methyltransferase [Nocardioides panacisoli]|uniref:Class I SAM-dependent methyltransferase n=1 Tax=Nocardioides panacisoli TaxID=627624 RepID=A0ABP7IKJ8_9ACTN
MTTQEPSAASGPEPALSFGSVVDAYERGRPGYPIEAVRWLTGDQPLSVLELGAGTGKLTRALVELGHDVHATEPDPAMLDRLARSVDVTRLSQTGAEEIPAADASFDIVIAGQSYHWFDKERALPEIARVLKRGGSLSLVWNVRDERIPWVKRFGRLIGTQESGAGPDDALESSPYFGPVEESVFKQWQVVDRESIQDMVLSRSNVATLPPDEREAKLREVLAFYDDFGRGMDGMQVPYVVRCYRAVVGIRPKTEEPPMDAAVPVTDDTPAPYEGEPTQPVRLGELTDPPSDDDSGVLLIDFR